MAYFNYANFKNYPADSITNTTLILITMLLEYSLKYAKISF